MITQRSELITDQPYFEEKSGQYFWTPDGIGCYWFESKKACLDDVDTTNLVIHIEELSDF